MEGNDHRFLRISGRIFEILSWVVLVLYVVAAFIIFFGEGGPDSPRVTGVLLSLLSGGVLFLILKTIGGVIRLLLDIESRIKP